MPNGDVVGKSDYYVYVYIDPRNHEQFYYGKGRGSRKNAHLLDKSDSKKARRIKTIQSEGLQPIIRVIACNLTEAEALLVEKTLLWNLGKFSDNVASGHFAEKFRPHNTLHKPLSGFDYKAGVYYYNVGEGKIRVWEDMRNLGFISAGQGARWRDYMLGFSPGDLFVAYLKKHGFVGMGLIVESAAMIRHVRIKGKPLLSLPVKSEGLNANCSDPEKSEYACKVKWLRTVSKEDAVWSTSQKLYTTTHVRASLDGQPATVSFLENEFKVQIREYVE
jgi:hypothetical protein